MRLETARLLFLIIITFCMNVDSAFAERLQDGLSPRLYYFHDELRSSSLEEILEREDHFQLAEDSTLNFGLKKGSFWLVLEVTSEFESDDYVVKIEYPMLDYVNFYQKDQSGDWQKSQIGDRTYFEKQEIEAPFLVFPYHLRKGKQQLVFEIATDGPKVFPISLVSKSKLNQSISHWHQVYSLVFGLLIAMFIYNLFITISLKSRLYLFYLGAILATITFCLAMSGYARLYFQFEAESSWISNDGLVLSTCIAVIFIYLFSLSFLEIRSVYPKLFRFLVGFVIVGICLLFASFLLPYSTASSIATLYVISSSTALFASSIVRLLSGFRPARFYVLAFTFQLLGMLSVAFLYSGLIKYSWLSINGVTFGSSIQVLLLSLALGDKINYEQNLARESVLEAHEKLKEQEKARTLFFHNTSHELRTPLNGIIGFLTLASNSLSKLESTKLSKQVSKSLRLAEGLKLQVNTILDLAKSKKGQLEANYQFLDLEELIMEAELIAEGLYQENRGLSFDSIFLNESNKHEARFIGDKEKIATILRNLIGNAFKFKDPKRDNNIQLKAVLTASHELVIEIRDTGIGIPEEDLVSIFDEFKQVDSDERRQYEGTGLGLAMVKDLVHLMSGRIQVVSKLGEGSCFSITVPEHELDIEHEIVNDNAAEKITSSQESEDLSTLDNVDLLAENIREENRNWKILVVDDNLINCEVITGVLEEDGYQVNSLTSGSGALSSIKKDRPDLILLDMMMPEVSGVDVIQKIRADDALKSLTVILVTARASQEDRIYGLDLGADDYLAKPVVAKELKLRVRQFIDKLKIQEQAKQLDLQRIKEMKSRVSLVADLAHRVNNPLNYILTAVDVVRLVMNEEVKQVEALLSHDDSQIKEIKRAFEDRWGKIGVMLSQMGLGIDKTMSSIKEIRSLSGVDGYNFERISLFELVSELKKRMESRELEFWILDSNKKRLKRCDEPTLYASKMCLLFVLDSVISSWLLQDESFHLIKLEVSNCGNRPVIFLSPTSTKLALSTELSEHIEVLLKPYQIEVAYEDGLQLTFISNQDSSAKIAG